MLTLLIANMHDTLKQKCYKTLLIAKHENKTYFKTTIKSFTSKKLDKELSYKNNLDVTFLFQNYVPKNKLTVLTIALF